ncbi:hypothetical protein V494_05428 [Pseudogymnoascus sp. VKM F-4513 (FW-928)]|nr:hypothetical protein V494_05428 [Pseudogymnoascus sp. VKM F-4513 (FW-928)]
MSYNLLANEASDKDSESDHADRTSLIRSNHYKTLFFLMLFVWAGSCGTWAWLQYTQSHGSKSSPFLSAGSGMVSIEQPEQYNLPPSYTDHYKNSTKAEVYSMSMYHQLHCLAAIRLHFGSMTGKFNADANKPITSRRVFRHESHLDHCFDYLRQAIMCAGDLALEASVVPNEFGFNGWGTSHQCADWRVMWDTAIAHRYMYDPDKEM